MPHIKQRGRSGFSLVEMLIIVAIIAILSGVVIPLFHNYQSKNDLYTSVSQITQALNRAKLLAESGKNSGAWGYNATNGVLFAGKSYASRDASYDELYDTPSTITASGITEVVFDQLTGRPSQTGSMILINDNGDRGVIQIGMYGVATLQTLLPICYQGVNMMIQDALWPTFKSKGAYAGACFGPMPYTCNNSGGVITTGMLLLEPSANDAFRVSGNGTATTTNGAIAVNSTDSTSANLNGGGSASATAFYFHGGYSGAFDGTICSGAFTRADPYASITPPSPDNPGIPAVDAKSSMTLDPGTYDGGIIAEKNGTVVTLNSGIYYLNSGGLTLKDSAIVTGNGVFIYNAGSTGQDTINLSNSSTLSLTPMTTGPYQGIAIFQDRSSSQSISIGNSATITIPGAIYAAGATLLLQSSADSTLKLFVGKKFQSSGGGNLTLQ